MIADEIRARLETLAPTSLVVIDESEQHRGHSGWREGGETHFRVKMAAPAFAGLTPLARHRLAHKTLGDLTRRVHALSLHLTGA